MSSSSNIYGYGLGSDGYIGIQKESNRSNAISNYTNFKTLPVNFESYIKYMRENIENKNLLGKRAKTKNDLGFELVEGQIILDAYPSLLGHLFSIVFGDEARNSQISTHVYEHQWEQVLDLNKQVSTFMIHQAFGGGAPEQFNHCIFDGINLGCEKGQNLKMTFPISHGHLDSRNIQRRSVFTYPAESPLNWSNITINEKNFLSDIKAHTINLNIDLNYRKNEFFLGSSKEDIAHINNFPTVNLSLNVDADKKYLDIARNNKYCDFEIKIENNCLISASSNVNKQYYSLIIQLPSCQLSPETTMEHSEERLTLDLNFDCSFISDKNINTIYKFILKDKNDIYQ